MGLGVTVRARIRVRVRVRVRVWVRVRVRVWVRVRVSTWKNDVTKKAKDSELRSTRKRRSRVYGWEGCARKMEMKTWLFLT